jgi:hypothetical protein
MKTRLILYLTAALLLFGTATVSFAAERMLYLSDSATRGDGVTYLFTVTLDDDAPMAVLVPLPVKGSLDPMGNTVPFDQVDAIAASADGSKLYLINRCNTDMNPAPGGEFGWYDLMTQVFHNSGKHVTLKDTAQDVPDIVLAAARNGTLYAASQTTNALYTVDPGTAVATLVGTLRNGGDSGACGEGSPILNIMGADMTFDSQGSFYLWTNGGADRGLYQLSYIYADASGPQVCALRLLGPTIAGDDGCYVTGLATNAQDELVVSTCMGDIRKLTSAGFVEVYPMMMDGTSSWPYTFGDMTSAPVPPSSVHSMTGGGTLEGTEGVSKLSHGFTLQCSTEDGPNNLNVNWRTSAGQQHFQLESLELVDCYTDDSGLSEGTPDAGFNAYYGMGYGKLNGVSGYMVEWTFTDHGQPGSDDTADISIYHNSDPTPVLDVGGDLTGGNHQAHK